MKNNVKVNEIVKIPTNHKCYNAYGQISNQVRYFVSENHV